MNTHINSRWQQFRYCEESIPATPYEAGVFLQNVRLHLISVYGNECMDARNIILHAHEEVNRTFFSEVA